MFDKIDWASIFDTIRQIIQVLLKRAFQIQKWMHDNFVWDKASGSDAADDTPVEDEATTV